MPELSIVIPTCNRATRLQRCLSSLAGQLRLDYEVIVVDGASTDGTAQVLAQSADMFGSKLRIISEQQRQGFVRAVNAGFRAATGEYLTWLNDDAAPVAGCYESAVGQLADETPATTLLALFHQWHSPRNVAYESVCRQVTYRLCHVRGTLYANFGLARRRVFEQLGYFDERYYLNAADPDFSLKVWHAGGRVAPALGCYIDHDEFGDDRRNEDSSRAAEDNAKLFAKWDLPPKNPHHNDFNPAFPCTLRGLKPEAARDAA